MAKDHETNVHELKEKIKTFCEARDWDKFHNAKDLAIAIIIESAELLEPFRWKSEQEVKELFENPQKKEHIEEEMADILYFLLRLAQRYNIDLSEALEKKIEKNNKKYPIEKAKGSNKKYNEL
ncbi:MAG: nucleotide pyrophosphohydrolase [Candidatus Pacearchaeota archaeon]|nr:nucleotide pyrophosphohydrolase [Candidatus Pacearchaeota archaeon]